MEILKLEAHLEIYGFALVAFAKILPLGDADAARGLIEEAGLSTDMLPAFENFSRGVITEDQFLVACAGALFDIGTGRMHRATWTQIKPPG
jgi:hypothetical protein